LLYARAQMAMSLGFHIVFAAIGVALPLMMVIAEWRWRRTGDSVYRELTHRWAKGTAVLFAVGAVSGTVLSFELGLLWPKFMEHAGPFVGMPFSLEGFAFFAEAIFLGIYLYGWDRVSPRMHLFAGVMVALSGAASAAFVVCANAWMNQPAGMLFEDGVVVGVDPVAAMFNPAAPHEVVHMLIACYLSTGAAVAAVHAFYLLRDPTRALHRKALGIAIAVTAVASVLQVASGDWSAKAVAELQPLKLAAMEGHWRDEAGAPLHIGGLPDEEARETPWAIEIPKGLSFLAFGDTNAEVRGITSFPEDEWPPIAITHVAFQIMVGCGFTILSVHLLAAFLAWRKKALPDARWLLRSIVFCGPLGFLAVEAGWVVTEVGRQPWIVYGVWRTADSVTPMPGLAVPFYTFTAIYVLLAAAVVFLLQRQFRKAQEEVK
jgi:cytochrome d ubiquinol oxidase subunit I